LHRFNRNTRRIARLIILSFEYESIGRMTRTLGNPNTQGPFGNTLLHSAVVSGDISEVHRLLAAGADPRIANREGLTAVRVAAIFGHDDIHDLLVRSIPA